MLPVNPEAIGLFGLIATVICFGLEQIGVGVKGADHTKLTTSLGLIAILFGGLAQIFTGFCMYLFSVGGDHSIYLGTVFSFLVCSGCWLVCSSSKAATKRLLPISLPLALSSV